MSGAEVVDNGVKGRCSRSRCWLSSHIQLSVGRTSIRKINLPGAW